MLHYLKQVDSTNNYLKTLLQNDRPQELSMFVAEEQTLGRGQQGNHWFGDKGKNHTGSIIFYPGILPPALQYQLSKLISLGIIQTLQHFVKPDKLSVKWPNDIYYGNQKIAGILIESSILGNHLDYIIGGIGINVNQESFPEYLPNPVSLRMITQKHTSLHQFNKLLQSEIYSLYTNEYLLGDQIDNDFLSRLYLRNISSKFQSHGQIFTARIKGVDQYGHILLEHDNGRIMTYGFKEVEYVLS